MKCSAPVRSRKSESYGGSPYEFSAQFLRTMFGWLRSFLSSKVDEISTKTMAKPSLQVIIVGGGIGGLAAAISIRLAGHSVIVLESAEKIEEVG